MAGTNMSASTMGTYLQEIWSLKATIAYRSNVVLPNLVDRSWEPDTGVGRGDTINIPSFSQNSSATKRSTFGTGAELTWSATQETQTQLLINQLAYKAYRQPVEMNAQQLSIYEPLLISGIGQAIMLTVDSEIAGTGIDGFSQVVGSDNVDVTDDDILTSEYYLNNANAPVEDRFAVVSPATRNSLMKVDVYRNNLYAGSSGNLQGDKGAGFIGSVYTLDFYMSNNLEGGTAGKKNGVFQREAIAYAEQTGINVVNDLNIQDGLFMQTAGYLVYGFIEVKGNHGVELDGK